MSSLHDLALQQKIELTNDNRNKNDLSRSKLAAKYDISYGPISNILKRKIICE